MMKMVLDERLKHRLIGLAVIVSLAAIFAPAIMKKSAQRVDREVGMRMQLPDKPVLPDVVVTSEKQLFKSVKVAHVKLPDLPKKTLEQPETRLAKIEMPVKTMETTVAMENPAVPERAVEKPTITVKKPEKRRQDFAAAAPEKRIAPKPVPVSRLAENQTVYSVQLASFAHRENAMILVNRLKSKGYVARVDKISSRQGEQYKVFVGKSREREQALKLKNQLAQGMQLYGFIVTGAG